MTTMEIEGKKEVEGQGDSSVSGSPGIKMICASFAMYLCCCNKIPEKSNLRKKGFIVVHNLRV